MTPIHGQTEEDLKKYLIGAGEKPFRVKQIFEWIYARGASTWEEMTDLGKGLRERLAQDFTFSTLTQVRTQHSHDQETAKFLWQLEDGALVESVLICSEERRTVCVSSQVGCPARCAFCASGKEGLVRNLTVAEIVEQVYQIDAHLKQKGERVSHVVFMGMGEPLENYDPVVQAIRFLIDPQRLNLSQRRITVSTVGIVDQIGRLAKEGFKVNLVLSLHAPNQRIRQKIIPYARKYSLDAILEAMVSYQRETKRDVTYEYTLLHKINDDVEQAQELSRLLAG